MIENDNKKWEELSSNLTLYLIFSDKNIYKQFNDLFVSSFDYNIDEAKHKEITDYLGFESNNPIDYITKMFNSNRKDYEKEKRVVLNACKFCFKLK